MTSDFIPGKSYYIKGKRPEEVKSEIKEWLDEKGIEVMEEDENSLLAYNNFYSFKISHIWISLKLKGHVFGTVITFDERVYGHWVGIVGPEYYYLDEIKKDIVRYLKGKKEIGIDTIGKYYALRYLPMLPALIIFIPLFLGLGDPLYEKLFLICSYFSSIFGMCLEFFIARKKLENLANSEEHYIEKYAGEEYKADIGPLIGFYLLMSLIFLFIYSNIP